jgi:hypothetical protein
MVIEWFDIVAGRCDPAGSILHYLGAGLFARRTRPEIARAATIGPEVRAAPADQGKAGGARLEDIDATGLAWWGD